MFMVLLLANNAVSVQNRPALNRPAHNR